MPLFRRHNSFSSFFSRDKYPKYVFHRTHDIFVVKKSQLYEICHMINCFYRNSFIIKVTEKIKKSSLGSDLWLWGEKPQRRPSTCAHRDIGCVSRQEYDINKVISVKALVINVRNNLSNKILFVLRHTTAHEPYFPPVMILVWNIICICELGTRSYMHHVQVYIPPITGPSSMAGL